MPRKRTGRKWCKFSDQNVQRHSVTSLETAGSLANGPSWGGGTEREVRILRLLSLLSMGGVCRRSLTAGKILFTRRQICSLYLLLWLCGFCNKFPLTTLSVPAWESLGNNKSPEDSLTYENIYNIYIYMCVCVYSACNFALNCMEYSNKIFLSTCYSFPLFIATSKFKSPSSTLLTFVCLC